MAKIDTEGRVKSIPHTSDFKDSIRYRFESHWIHLCKVGKLSILKQKLLELFNKIFRSFLYSVLTLCHVAGSASHEYRNSNIVRVQFLLFLPFLFTECVPMKIADFQFNGNFFAIQRNFPLYENHNGISFIKEILNNDR